MGCWACFHKRNTCFLDEISLSILEESSKDDERGEPNARIKKWLDESSDHHDKTFFSIIGGFGRLRLPLCRNGRYQNLRDPDLENSLPRRNSEFDSCYSDS